ncbi:MAG: hypothetical protein ACLSH5_09595 [Christensenellales bacterium]
MKRFLAAVLAGAMALSLGACSQTAEKPGNETQEKTEQEPTGSLRILILFWTGIKRGALVYLCCDG